MPLAYIASAAAAATTTTPTPTRSGTRAERRVGCSNCVINPPRSARVHTVMGRSGPWYATACVTAAPTLPIDLPPGRWAVGISGGADSVALARLAAGGDVVLAHLDHQLRGDAQRRRRRVRRPPRPHARRADGNRPPRRRRNDAARSVGQPVGPLPRGPVGVLRRRRPPPRLRRRSAGAPRRRPGRNGAAAAAPRAGRGRTRGHGGRHTGRWAACRAGRCWACPARRSERTSGRSASRGGRTPATRRSTTAVTSSGICWRRTRRGRRCSCGVAGASAGLRRRAGAASPVLGESFAVTELPAGPVAAEGAVRRWLVARGGPPDRISPTDCRRLIEQATDVTTPPRQHYAGGVLVRRRGGRVDAIPSPAVQSRPTHGKETARAQDL